VRRACGYGKPNNRTGTSKDETTSGRLRRLRSTPSRLETARVRPAGELSGQGRPALVGASWPRRMPNIPTVAMAFGGGETAGRWFARQDGWWESHYGDAVDQITDFLEGDGLSLSGCSVLDIGCGDGIIAFGLASRTRAEHVTGIDLEPVDSEFLASMARQHGANWPCPNLTFAVATEEVFPVPDRSVDVAVSWSVFEHVADLPSLLRETGRVLKPGAHFFCQVWPMFHSEHGSHLWNWLDPFTHLVRPDEELRAAIDERAGDVAKPMLDLYDSCSRVTVDEIGKRLREAGFYIAKVELLSGGFHVPPELQDLRLSLLGITGFKLLAVNHSSM
jgi:ubiquinone/menaquinone biosynthesis C-methylase UbiE